MKSRNKIILTLIYSIVILLIIVTGFSLANSNVAKNTGNIYESNFSPTGDRTYVRLNRTANDKIDVYLEMADTTVIEEEEKEKSGVSVASFQIGLNIGVDLESEDKSVVNFQFDEELLKIDETYCKLRTTTTEPITKTYSSSEGEEEPITKTIGEKLHIFYVGTKELNDANKPEGIKIGTISFDNFEKEETISVEPDSEFTKIASINHKESEINIAEEDKLEDLIINPESDTPTATPSDNETDDTETNTTSNETDTPETSSNLTNNGTTEEDTIGNSDDNQNEADSSVPKTGDIAIKLFVTLMIASLVGIVIILIIKKRRK